MADTNVPDLANVLAEVNRLRAERGLEPLSEMPKGLTNVAHCCPVARALRNGSTVRVYPPSDLGGRGWYDVGTSIDKPLPQVLANFARLFDDGFYPNLVGRVSEGVFS